MRSLLFVLAVLCTYFASAGTVTAVASGDWDVASTWDINGIPGNATTSTTVVIPAGITVNVKSQVYSSTIPIITLQIYGTLSFHPSGRLDLSSTSTIQLYSGSSIVPFNNSNSQLITIGGVTKYNAANNGTVSGPAYASSSTGTSTSGQPLSGFAAGTLPIKLLHFTAMPEEKSVQLNWETAEEVNTDHFELEKSVDGDNAWLSIASLRTNGHPSVYTVVDNNVTGSVLYYRLKTVDRDGKYAYSAIVRIRRERSLSLFITPNPATSLIRVSLDQQRSDRTTIQLINSTGQLVRQAEMPGGSNILSLSIADLARGRYTVVVLANKELLDSESLVIQ
jgi:hypothetical protein